MDLIKTITKNVKIVLKNRIEEQAIENMLYSKIAHLFSLKNIKFVSTNNLKKPATLAYYAVNFINSGGSKNQAVNVIDDCVLPFIKDEYERLDKDIADRMLKEELEFLDETDKGYNREKKKLEKKYANGGVINFKTNGGTPAALYEKLDKIEKYKKGGLFAQITEFSDYFRASVENSLSINKSFLDCLNNLYDGLFEPSDSMGTNRREIRDVAFSLLFMSDIEELLEPRNNLNFRRRLKSGYARRINFYINKDINYSKVAPQTVTVEQKLLAYDELKFCSALIKKYYDELPSDTIFKFDEDANEALDEWEMNCQKEVSKFYEYKENLGLEDNIKKIELENSTWKIAKMAVLIQLLKGDSLPKVTVDSVSRAIEFYKKCRKSLYDILNERAITKEAELAGYFLSHIGEVVKRNDIRALQLVNKDFFSKWLKEALADVQNMLNEKGFELVQVKKVRNTQGLICQKIIQPSETPINVSYSNDKAPHPAKGYEYTECSTDAFTDLILNCKALSGQKFKDGYRTDDNCIGEQNTIWLDFDDGMTIDEAKERFKDFWYVIYTTPHHRKKKDKKKACDRFRVILKVKNPLPKSKERFKKVMSAIIAEYGADVQCQNISRYYKGNHEAEIYIQEDGEYFNWEFYEIPDKKPRNESGQRFKNVEDETKYNSQGLTDKTIFTELGNKILKTYNFYEGNRDGALTYTVGVLIKAVKDKKLSHDVALSWLNNELNKMSTPDFEQNAEKFRKRLRELKF